MSTKPQRQRPGASTLIAQPESLIVHTEVPTAENVSEKPASQSKTARIELANQDKGARVKRSIQLDSVLADQYDDQVFLLHAKLRVPKNRIHDAMLRVALDHLDEVQSRIKNS